MPRRRRFPKRRHRRLTGAQRRAERAFLALPVEEQMFLRGGGDQRARERTIASFWAGCSRDFERQVCGRDPYAPQDPERIPSEDDPDYIAEVQAFHDYYEARIEESPLLSKWRAESDPCVPDWALSHDRYFPQPGPPAPWHLREADWVREQAYEEDRHRGLEAAP
jgi:hypothetical protein